MRVDAVGINQRGPMEAHSSAILSANSKRDDRRCCAEQPAGSSMNTCLFMQRDPSTPPSDGSHFPIYRYPQNNRASGSYSVHNGPYNSYSYVHVQRERDCGAVPRAGRYSIYVGIPTGARRRGPDLPKPECGRPRPPSAGAACRVAPVPGTRIASRRRRYCIRVQLYVSDTRTQYEVLVRLYVQTAEPEANQKQQQSPEKMADLGKI